MNEIMRNSTLRILRTHFNIGLVDNPYLSIEKAETVPNNAEHNARGYQAMLRSVVMLKNSGGMITQGFGRSRKTYSIYPKGLYTCHYRTTSQSR
jgi:beta-glucosidase